MARFLVVGATGMLGHKVCQTLAQDGHAVTGTVRRALPGPWSEGCTILPGHDVADLDRLARTIAAVAPDYVVNCAGVIKQNAAAQDHVETVRMNALLPHWLAAKAQGGGARLIHVSTDCVFSGRSGGYTEGDVPDATDLYGRSKLVGEVQDSPHLTLRTSIIGRALKNEEGLVEWFLANRGRQVRGFTRARFSGVTTAVLAKAIGAFASRNDLTGLYHLSADPIDKHTLLSKLNAMLGGPVRIAPDAVFAIDRSLDSSRLRQASGWQPPTWDTMLAALAAEVPAYDALRVQISSISR